MKLIAAICGLALWAGAAGAAVTMVPSGSGSSGSNGPSINQWTLGTPSVVGTNLVLDASAANYFRFTLTNNVGVLLTNGTDPQAVILELAQDAVGFRTVVVKANTAGASTNDVVWSAEVPAFYIPTNGTYRSRMRWQYHGVNNTWTATGLATGR